MEKAEEQEEFQFKMKTKLLMLLGITVFLSLFYINLTTASLVARWEMDSTSLIEDIASGKYNVTSISGASLATDRFGAENEALKMQGVIGDYLDAITNKDDLLEWDEGSWSVWFNVSNLESGTYFNLIAVDESGYSNDTIIQIDRNGLLRFNWQSDGTEYPLYSTLNLSKSENQNKWWNVIVTWNSSGRRIYINGVLDVSDSVKIRAGSVGRKLTLYASESTSNVIILDDFRVYNHSLSQEEINEIYLYTGEEINLVSPADSSTLSSTIINFTVNGKSNYNFTNVTFYVWNSTGIFNTSFVDIPDNKTFSETVTISDFSLGSYEWNVKACGENATSTFCNWAASNYTFTVGATLIDLIYNNKTYETSSETFTAEFNILEGAEISLAQLVYNGTNYTISNLTYQNTTHLILTKTIDIPLNPNPFQNTTNSFFFRFTYAGDQIQETSPYNQEVGFINFQKCNSTYPTTTLNFTYRDEFDNSEINASKNSTSMEVTFNYWLGSGSVYKNYSFQNLSMSDSQVKFCLYPSHITLKTDMDMDYEATDYSPRQYYFRNATLTNQTREIPLTLLLTEYSVKFFVTLKQGTDFFSDGIVTISKYFTGEGEYRTISIRKSDDKGEFVEYFDLDKNYKFSIVKDGVSYGTIEKWITCQEAPCTLTLDLEDISADIWEGYYDYFATNVVYNLTYDDDTKIVTFTFNDLTGLAQYFRLEVLQTRYNETSATICNKTLYTTAGTLTCNLTGYEGQFTAKAYVSRSPEKFVDYFNFAISTIKETLGLTGILVTLFFIITIALVGAWNPAAGVALLVFSILMMSVLGFTAFSYTTVMAIIIIGLILIIKMRT